MIETILSHAATVAVLACLISESNIAAPLRKWFDWRVLYCPICLGFWIALPTFWFGIWYYFLVVATSNVWMLVILKVYEALDAAASEE
jgi:hypothetical protein